MIILFLLPILITQIQAGQHQLTPPTTRSYMSMSKQELQREQEIKQQEILDENTRWHQTEVCDNVTRDAIGMSTIFCIVTVGAATSAYFKFQHEIAVASIFGTAAAFERWYQPDQRAKKAELEEINAILKIKTD